MLRRHWIFFRRLVVVLFLFSSLPNICCYQGVETGEGEDGHESDAGEDDIEAQIRKEVEGLKPGSDKSRQFQAIRMNLPCGLSIPFLV